MPEEIISQVPIILGDTWADAMGADIKVNNATIPAISKSFFILTSSWLVKFSSSI
jgi:hypothetical protein